LVFAHWFGYEIIIAHSKGGFPADYVRAHSLSACVHFVEVQADMSSAQPDPYANAGGGLFSARYRNALAGMAAHPTAFVIHEDLDSDFGPRLRPPFFLDAATQDNLEKPHSPCPTTPKYGRRCAPCGSPRGGTLSPNLFLSVSDPFDIGRSESGRLQMDPGFHAYVQSQMSGCFGPGTRHNKTYNVTTFPLWFSGQVSGDSAAVRRILHRTNKLLLTAPVGAVCDMAALTLTLQSMGLGDHNICGASGDGHTLFASYTKQALHENPVGLLHSHQIEWVHLIYPTMLGRNVSDALYPPAYKNRLREGAFVRDVSLAARPLLHWRKHASLKELVKLHAGPVTSCSIHEHEACGLDPRDAF